MRKWRIANATSRVDVGDRLRFLVRVRCSRKESSRSLSHLLMSFLLTNSVNVNEVVRRNCCNLVSEDRKRIFEFLRELLSCMDWYGWNGECILSRDEMHVTGKDTVLVLVILREKR